MLRILVVENPNTPEVFGQLFLKELGHSVIVSWDNSEAFEIAQKIIPDIIFMDVGLIRLDNWKACENLKSSRCTRNIPIVMFGNEPAKKVNRMLKRTTVDAYIRLPFSKGNVEKQIYRIYEHFESIQAVKPLSVLDINSCKKEAGIVYFDPIKIPA